MKKIIDYVAVTIQAILFHGKRLHCKVSQTKSKGYCKITWKKTVEGDKQKCSFKVYDHGNKQTFLEHMYRIDALESAIYGKES